METIWETIIIDGVVICYVDQTDLTHLKIYTRRHGKVVWIEVWAAQALKKVA